METVTKQTILKITLIIVIMLQILVQQGSGNYINLNNSNRIITNQNQYSLTVSDNNVTINQGDEFNLTVVLTLDSVAVTNAYFEVLDPSDQTIVDIGENQIHNGNGNYTLIFDSNSTNEIVPGNYTAFIAGIHDNEITKEEITLNVIPIDSVDPILNILAPANLNNVNESIFELILEGRDDIFWKDVSVDIGEINLYYLSNKPGLSSDLPDLTLNATYLYLAIWVNLPGIPGLNASQISVTLRDQSFNEATFGLTLTGDYVKPTAFWQSHSDNEVIFSRNITLEWSVTDDSPIKSQVLELNNRKFLPGGSALSSNQNSINFVIPIPVNKAQILEFRLIVTDIFDNSNSIDLVLVYDPAKDDNNIIDDNISFDTESALIGLGGLIVSLILGVIIYQLRQRSGKKSRTLSKGFLKVYQTKPGFSQLELNISDEIFVEINDILNDFRPQEQLEEDKTTIRLMIDIMQSRFEYLLFQNTENEQFKIMIENSYMTWIEELKRSI